jgi:prepilin-type N-terminal cleavage/methylation domain-containing protein
MTKNAFTLIELLVVITIITLLTSSGVIYFFRQVSSIQIASEIEKVVDIVDELDSQIDNKKILDYNIYINKNSL